MALRGLPSALLLFLLTLGVPSASPTAAPFALSSVCTAMGPVCAGGSTNYSLGWAPPANNGGAPTGCVGTAIGRSGWGYWRAVGSADVTLEVTAGAPAAQLSVATWGPFPEPWVCGTPLGPPAATACRVSPPIATLTLNTAGGAYYVFLLNVIGGTAEDTIPVTITQVGGTGATDCTLLNFFVRGALLGPQAQVTVAVEGSALSSGTLGAQTVGVVPLSTACGAAAPLATYSLPTGTTRLTLNTSALAGSYRLCLRTGGNAYSPSAAAVLQVRGWTITPDAAAGSSGLVTLTAAGADVASTGLVAVIPQSDPCGGASTLAAAFPLPTPATFVLNASLLPVGAYRVCFQTGGLWWPQGGTDFAFTAPFWLTAPSLGVTGRGFAVALAFAGSAVATSGGRHEVALFPGGQDCTTATGPPLRSAVSAASAPTVVMDLSALPAGTYAACYGPVAPSPSSSAYTAPAATLTVVDFAIDRPFVFAQSNQALAFSGSAVDFAGAVVALMAPGDSCGAAPVLTLAPTWDAQLDTAGLPQGLYTLCAPSPPGLPAIPLPLAVLAPTVTIQPTLLARSARAQLTVAIDGLLGAPWASATMVPPLFGCDLAANDPLGLSQVLDPLRKAALTVEWDLQSLPAGLYIVCLRTAQSPEAWGAPITIVDLRAATQFISPATGSVTLLGSLLQSSALPVTAVPWPTACPSASGTAPLTASWAPGSATLQLLNPSGAYRLCVGNTWDLYVATAPPFALGRATFCQDAHADLQSMGTALTGPGDQIAIVAGTDCGTPNPLVLGPASGPFDLSTLSPGPYTACLLPAGSLPPATNLTSQPITIVGIGLYPSTVFPVPTSLFLTGALAANGGGALAIVPPQVDCAAAGAGEFPIVATAFWTVDFSPFVPGLYKACLRLIGGTYTSTTFVTILVEAVYQVRPQVIARSAVTPLTVTANATTPVTLALVTQPRSCATAFQAAVWQADIMSQSAGGWDFSFLPVGDYWMCFQSAGGNFTPQAAVAVRVVDLQLGAQFVAATAGASLVLLGALVAPGAAAVVAVVPASIPCGAAATASIVGNVTSTGSVALDLSPLAGGPHRLCYRSALTQFPAFADGLELALTVVAAPNVAFTPTAIPAGSAQTLTLSAGGRPVFTPLPGGDQLLLLPATAAGCAGTPILTSAANPAPFAAANVPLAEWTVTVGTPGTYQLCYQAAGAAAAVALSPPLVVTGGVVSFTGETSVALECCATQYLRVATTDPGGSAPAGELAFAPTAAPWQLPSGGCAGPSFPVGPIAVANGGTYPVQFPAPGVQTACYRASGAATFLPVATLLVASPGCASPPGGALLPRTPCTASCNDCLPEMVWVWPAILFPLLTILLFVVLWLLLCPRGRVDRIRRKLSRWHSVDEAAAAEEEEMLEGLDPGPLTAKVSDEVVEGEAQHLGQQLARYRQQLDELRQRPLPPQVRRIEVPVERVVEVPVVHIEERPVHVDRVVTVRKPKIVEREVVTEVEKEVVRDRDVDDPSVALHIQWAQDDIAHLRDALESTTAELEAVQAELRALGYAGARGRSVRSRSGSRGGSTVTSASLPPAKGPPTHSWRTASAANPSSVPRLPSRPAGN